MCPFAPGLHISLSPVQDGRRPGSTGSRSIAWIMHHLIVTATAAFLILPAQSASAQDLRSQIVGIWKWSSHVYKEVATGKTTNVFGEKPSGLQVFTQGGNALFAVFADSRKAPAANPATEAESAALLSTMAAATSTYKVEGNTLTMTYSGSWNQSWTGTTQKRQIEIVGNKLTLMSAPFKSPQSGQEIVFVVTYERVE